jgi:hypothetical protein
VVSLQVQVMTKDHSYSVRQTRHGVCMVVWLSTEPKPKISKRPTSSVSLRVSSMIDSKQSQYVENKMQEKVHLNLVLSIALNFSATYQLEVEYLDICQFQPEWICCDIATSRYNKSFNNVPILDFLDGIELAKAYWPWLVHRSESSR